MVICICGRLAVETPLNKIAATYRDERPRLHAAGITKCERKIYDRYKVARSFYSRTTLRSLIHSSRTSEKAATSPTQSRENNIGGLAWVPRRVEMIHYDGANYCMCLAGYLSYDYCITIPPLKESET